MRLIDADALLQRAVLHGWSTPKWVSDIMIGDAPTIDAVPIVRCKDCRYNYANMIPNCKGCQRNVYIETDDNFFCANGER